MAFQLFEDLQVWRRGKELAVVAYISVKDCQDFGLRDQMQRLPFQFLQTSPRGCERTPKDFARFISTAIGASSELRTQAYIARNRSIIDAETADAIIDETKQLNRMLRALAITQLKNLKS